MKKLALIGSATLAAVALAGCIHVDEGDFTDVDEVAINTEAALRVCGGEGTVAEVTDDGFTCKEE